MEFVHFSIAAVQRSKQQSSVGRAAYQSGQRLVDERTGQVHDYRYRRKHGEILSSMLVHPDGRVWEDPSPSLLGSLWNQVERAERRRDAQVGRTGIVALPHRLSRGGQREVALRFSQELARRYHTPVHFDLHAPSRRPGADIRNVHGHWQIPTRSLNEHGGFDRGAKIKCLSHRTEARTEIKALRRLWVDTVNEALEREGIVREDGSPLRLDARGFRARGLDRIPEVHVGVAATALERQGIPTSPGSLNRAIRVENAMLAQLDEELGRLAEERVLLLAQAAPEPGHGGAGEGPDPGETSPGDPDTEGQPPESPHDRARADAPVLTGLVADITRYRELVRIEDEERRLLDRISAAEQESRSLSDGALRAAHREFAEELRRVFRDGPGAERAWRAYRTEHGDERAVEALRERPEEIGSLRVERISRFGIPHHDDRAAREAVPQAADAGSRLCRELARMERSRAAAEAGRARLHAELAELRRAIGPRDALRVLQREIADRWHSLPPSLVAMLEDVYSDIARMVAKTVPELGLGLGAGPGPSL